MPKAATKEPADDATVDNKPEVDDFRSGQVSEAEQTVAESVARRMGWVPKEEWSRDPTRWVDATQYLEQTPAERQALKDRLKRTAQATQDVINDERRRAREQALADLRAAERAGEADKAEAAAERFRQTEGPPPAVSSWIARNAWFNEDPAANAVAVAVTNRLKDRPVAEQLEAAEAEVQRRFPEHFGPAPRERDEEIRLSEVRRPPPVQSGSRGASSAPKEKGFGDLPPGDRAMFTQKLLKHFKARGMTETQAQDRFAASYWRDQA